jgi:hypothetical protein
MCRKLSFILSIIVLGFTFDGCKHEVPGLPPPPVDTVCFSEEILPVFQTYCARTGGCHDATWAQKGYVLNSYTGIMQGIVPFKPGKSDIYEVITETDPDDVMPPPPDPPLSEATKKRIRQWIEQGAMNTVCANPCDTVDVKYSVQIKNLLGQHCMGCHRGPGSSSGIDLEGYANVKAYVDNGLLYKAINHEPGGIPMPYNLPKMADCKIRVFKIWIDAGAPNN